MCTTEIVCASELKIKYRFLCLKNNIFLSIFLALLIVSSILHGTKLSFAADFTSEQVINQATSAWNNYIQILKCCEGNITSKKLWYKSDGTVSQQEIWSSETISNFPCLVTSTSKNGGKSHVFGLNKKYTFNLTETENQLWEIIDIDSRVNYPQDFKWDFREWIRPEPFSTYTAEYRIVDSFAPFFFVAGLPLPVLIKNPDFKLIELEETINNNCREISISFTYSPENYSPFAPVRKGTIVLLPDYDWVIKEMTLFLLADQPVDTLSTPVRLSMVFEYDFRGDIPLIKSFSLLSFTNETLIWSANSEYSINLLSQTNLPSRFTLSHYGLPEPDFGERRTNRIRYIIMAVGLIMIGIGAWRMIQKRRENA